MSGFFAVQNEKKSAALFLLVIFMLLGNTPRAFAHGGEDHSESKPVTTAGEKGTVSHIARLGELEIMIKHASLEPDAVTAARLFITNFQTNAPAEKVSPAVEIESANGSVSALTIEKTDSAGSYNLTIPSVPAGNYTLRAKVSYEGETDTATFTGVRVEKSPAESSENVSSRSETGLLILFGLIILSLFGGLIYFAVREAKNSRAGEEVVSV